MMSAEADPSHNIRTLLQSPGLPCSTTMESIDPLKAWFAQADNVIQPVIGGRRVDTGKYADLDSLVDVTWVPGVRVAVGGGATQNHDEKGSNARSGWDLSNLTKSLASFVQALQKNQGILALAIAADSGRHVGECGKFDIPMAVKTVQYFGICAQEMFREQNSWQPAGLVDIVVSTSSPVAATVERLCPALLTGNHVRLLTPLKCARSVSILMDCLLQAGISQVDFVPLVNAADRKLYAGNVLDLSLTEFDEALDVSQYDNVFFPGRCRSAAIVSDTADVDSAAAALINSVLFSSGQWKGCPSKIVIQESIYEKFLGAVRAKAEHIRSGSPLDKSADYCFRADLATAIKLQEHINQAQNEGAELIWFGPVPQLDKVTDRYVSFPAVIISNVGTTSVFLTDHYRGPSAVLLPFRTLKEAVSVANNGRYGDCVSVWAENITGALEVARAVRASTVWINGCHLYDPAAGSGGSGASGWAVHGREALLEFLSWNNKPHLSKSVPQEEKEAVDNKPEPSRKYKFYYGNGLKTADSGSSVTVSLSTGLGTADIPRGSGKDMKAAIEAGVSGAVAWAKTAAISRGQVLTALADGLVTRRDPLVTLLQGMSGSAEEANKEMDAAVTWLRMVAGDYAKGQGSLYSVNETTSVMHLLDPCGVIGVALPEEYPLVSLVAIISSIIAAGNCVVAVPVLSASAAVALELCQVLSSISIPAGVINIITGNQSELMEMTKMYPDVSTVWLFENLPSEKNDSWLEEAKHKRIWRPTGFFASGYEWSLLRMNLLKNNAIQHKRIWTNSFQSFVN